MGELKYKILLVDDEPDILEFLGYNLKAEGYKVYKADNGTDAIKIAKKSKPHLILLDIMMPGMSGYEVCERIRAVRSTEELPVIMVTAKNMLSDINEIG